MKSRFLISCLLLLLVLAGGAFAQMQVQRVCDEMTELLKASAGEEEATKFEAARVLWEKNQGFLSALVKHERVDAVSESFSRAGAFLSEATEDEYRAEVSQLIGRLWLIREYDQLTFRSIF